MPADSSPVVLDCDAYTSETFIDLVRHLRNFEAIGDAAQDPWLTLHLDGRLSNEIFDEAFPHLPEAPHARF